MHIFGVPIFGHGYESRNVDVPAGRIKMQISGQGKLNAIQMLSGGYRSV